jgi:hypothetical protein
MEIKIGHFCGLSSSSSFRNWLKNQAADLYDLITNTQLKGCRSKQEKMIDIKNKLYERGKGQLLEAFIKDNYPYMIDNFKEKQEKQQKQIVLTNKPQIDRSEINKHSVFKTYRPDLLTFPHKYIIIDDQKTILSKVKDFIKDKVGVDYIIIDDHAYIEYFNKRYSDVVSKIKSEDREIWQYKQRKNQNI